MLNATANVPGSFAYTPGAGTVLAAGTRQLSVLFTPTNVANYTTATASRSITVQPTAPSITSAPATVVTRSGTTATFTVTATGTAPLSYAWTRNGQPISGQTAATLQLTASDATAGTIAVTVSNSAGSATASATLTVVDFAATHVARSGYTAGGTVTIDVTVTYSGALTSLQMPILVPADVGGESWTFASSSGAQIFPGGDASMFADWSIGGVPTSPITFNYTLNVPSAATGDHELAAWLVARVGTLALDDMVTPDPLVLTEAATFHSADIDGDFRLSLSELLRVIELYNTRFGTTRTGRYRVAAGTEDGFASDNTGGGPVVLTRYHSADSNRDGLMSLSELLRVIELYNTRAGTTRTGAYHPATGTEDGFASGPQP